MTFIETVTSLASKLSASALAKFWPAFLVVGACGLLAPDSLIADLAPLISLELAKTTFSLMLLFGLVGAISAAARPVKDLIDTVTVYVSDRWLLFRLGKEARVWIGYMILTGKTHNHMYMPSNEAYQRLVDRHIFSEECAGNAWRIVRALNGASFIQRCRPLLRKEAKTSPELFAQCEREERNAMQEASDRI